MRGIKMACLVVGFVAAAGWGNSQGAKEDKETRKKIAPRFTVSKETTHVTGPLTPNGTIDYETALNQRLGKGVTPATNANVLLWKAFGPHPEGTKMPPAFFTWLGILPPPERGDYFLPLFSYVQKQPDLDSDERRKEVLDQQGQAAQRPWTAKQYPHLAAWLKANEKPLALVIDATKRPHYFNPLVSRKDKDGNGSLISVLLPGVQKGRELAAALAARAVLRLSENRYEDAWQDLLACHRLGRLLARGGTLIEALVGIAIDHIACTADLAYLAHAQLTAKQLQAKLADMQKLPPLPPMADKITLAERFMYLESLMLIRNHGINYLEGLSNGKRNKDPDPKVQQSLHLMDWDPAMRTGNRWYDRMVAALRKQDRAAREKELDQILKDLAAMKKELVAGMKDLEKALLAGKDPGPVVSKAIGDVLIGLLMPAVHKVQHAADRNEQVQRNLHVAFALAAYHREQGRYPEKLAALTPHYLAQVPGDLFSDKPLIYRPAKEGYLLYSVGINGKDEGGRTFGDDPSGDDLRVRMPLPEPKRK